MARKKNLILSLSIFLVFTFVLVGGVLGQASCTGDNCNTGDPSGSGGTNLFGDEKPPEPINLEQWKAVYDDDSKTNTEKTAAWRGLDPLKKIEFYDELKKKEPSEQNKLYEILLEGSKADKENSAIDEFIGLLGANKNKDVGELKATGFKIADKIEEDKDGNLIITSKEFKTKENTDGVIKINLAKLNSEKLKEIKIAEVYDKYEVQGDKKTSAVKFIFHDGNKDEANSAIITRGRLEIGDKGVLNIFDKDGNPAGTLNFGKDAKKARYLRGTPKSVKTSKGVTHKYNDGDYVWGKGEGDVSFTNQNNVKIKPNMRDFKAWKDAEKRGCGFITKAVNAMLVSSEGSTPIDEYKDTFYARGTIEKNNIITEVIKANDHIVSYDGYKREGHKIISLEIIDEKIDGKDVRNVKVNAVHPEIIDVVVTNNNPEGKVTRYDSQGEVVSQSSEGGRLEIRKPRPSTQQRTTPSRTDLPSDTTDQQAESEQRTTPPSTAPTPSEKTTRPKPKPVESQKPTDEPIPKSPVVDTEVKVPAFVSGVDEFRKLQSEGLKKGDPFADPSSTTFKDPNGETKTTTKSVSGEPKKVIPSLSGAMDAIKNLLPTPEE